MKLHSVLKSITNIALTALILVPLGHTPARDQRPRQFSDPAAHFAALSYFPVFGDFDGDRRLDQAEPLIAGAHQFIRLRFGNSLESHLEFRARREVFGALLARDINHDSKADLIWVYQSQLEPPVVWMGDGLGHFAMAAEDNTDTDLRSMLFGDRDPALVEDVNGERVYLAPHLMSSEEPHTSNLDDDIPKALVITGDNRRRDLRLFLSYLRERGPPLL